MSPSLLPKNNSNSNITSTIFYLEHLTFFIHSFARLSSDANWPFFNCSIFFPLESLSFIFHSQKWFLNSNPSNWTCRLKSFLHCCDILVRFTCRFASMYVSWSYRLLTWFSYCLNGVCSSNFLYPSTIPWYLTNFCHFALFYSRYLTGDTFSKASP